MKKLIFLIFILLIPVVLSAQQGHAGYCIREVDSTSCTWQIVGTESDTSSWKLSFPTMSIYGFPCDTTSGANGDSVASTLIFQSTNSGKDVIITEATKSFTTADDSVDFVWNLTASTIGCGMYYRIINTGTGDNDKDAGSLWKFYFDGFPLK